MDWRGFGEAHGFQIGNDGTIDGKAIKTHLLAQLNARFQRGQPFLLRAFCYTQESMKALSEIEIEKQLKNSPKWAREGSEIKRDFIFSGFPAAIDFVNRVAKHADQVDHHPDIIIRYNKVQLKLSTHDAGGLSERDFSFAQVVNKWDIKQ